MKKYVLAEYIRLSMEDLDLYDSDEKAGFFPLPSPEKSAGL